MDGERSRLRMRLVMVAPSTAMLGLGLGPAPGGVGSLAGAARGGEPGAGLRSLRGASASLPPPGPSARPARHAPAGPSPASLYLASPGPGRARLPVPALGHRGAAHRSALGRRPLRLRGAHGELRRRGRLKTRTRAGGRELDLVGVVCG